MQMLTKSLEDKKITKEEYKKRYRAIKTALEQRISALEMSGEGDREETQRTVASSATQATSKVVPNEVPKVTLTIPVPTKRKSSERLSDPKPGHPKVSNTCDSSECVCLTICYIVRSVPELGKQSRVYL